MSKRTLIVLIALLLITGGIIWAVSRRNKNNDQATAPVLAVSAYNQTKKLPATQIAASPNDIIVYTLSAENKTDKVILGYVVEANIADVVDKSTLIDAAGASYNSATNSLVWTPLDIPSKGTIQKQLSVRVNPLKPGSTNTVMKIRFNNELEIAVQSQQVAGANTNVNNGPGSAFDAPVTGPSGDLSLWLAGLSTAVIAGIKRFRLIKA